MGVVAWDVMDPIRSLITSAWGYDDMPLSAPEAPPGPRPAGTAPGWGQDLVRISHRLSPVSCQSPPPAVGAPAHR